MNNVVPWIVFWLLRGIGPSLRWNVFNEEFFRSAIKLEKGAIFACWHNDLLFLPYMYDCYYDQKKLSVLTSMSKDGKMIAYVLERFNINIGWGSSSRYGSSGFRALQKDLNRGRCVCITPDGPKGPRRQVHKGIVSLSKITGAPILPIACEFKCKKEIGSWDKLKIPMPFSKAGLAFNDLIYIPENASSDEEQAYGEVLRDKLNQTEQIIQSSV